MTRLSPCPPVPHGHKGDENSSVRALRGRPDELIQASVLSRLGSVLGQLPASGSSTGQALRGRARDFSTCSSWNMETPSPGFEDQDLESQWICTQRSCTGGQGFDSRNSTGFPATRGQEPKLSSLVWGSNGEATPEGSGESLPHTAGLFPQRPFLDFLLCVWALPATCGGLIPFCLHSQGGARLVAPLPQPWAACASWARPLISPT